MTKEEFYENEIELCILNGYKQLFGFDDESFLILYLLLRKRILNEAYLDMVEKDLKLEIFQNSQENQISCVKSFIYKNEPIKAHMIDIIFENLYYIQKIYPVIWDRKNYSLEKWLNHLEKAIIKKSNQLIKKIKIDKLSSDIVLYFKLTSLNTLFHLEINENIPDLKSIQQISEVKLKRPRELDLQLIYESLFFMNNTLLDFKEKDVEDFLIKHLDLIEEGMAYIDRQVAIEDGIIDILAKDKNGIYAIIELKIKDDERLAWQCLYYPKLIKKTYHVKEVRMIVLAPCMPDKIKDVLLDIGISELLTYEPVILNKKIENIIVKKGDFET